MRTGNSALVRYERNELEDPKDIIQSKMIEKQDDRTLVFLLKADLQLLFCCFSKDRLYTLFLSPPRGGTGFSN